MPSFFAEGDRVIVSDYCLQTKFIGEMGTVIAIDDTYKGVQVQLDRSIFPEFLLDRELNPVNVPYVGGFEAQDAGPEMYSEAELASMFPDAVVGEDEPFMVTLAFSSVDQLLTFIEQTYAALEEVRMEAYESGYLARF